MAAAQWLGDCLSFLCDPVKELLRTTVTDWVVAEIKGLIFFLRHGVEPVPVTLTDLADREGIKGYLQEIGGYLKADHVGVIGIHGMGGVGKTTLLDIINNKFPEMGVRGCYVVIRVTDTLDIQRKIGERLGLSLPAESLIEERARVLTEALSKWRFLLLLDDVFESLNLNSIGIPPPTRENKCKIILASRVEEVCRDMGAERSLVKVKLLNESESWELFKKHVDGVHLDLEKSPGLHPDARAVMRKCGGLPRALRTVGGAMNNVSSMWVWSSVLRQLRESPQDVPRMREEVLECLKRGFDRLADENERQCLLYCCLFPEDTKIPEEQLIEYWVGEGFLDSAQLMSIDQARYQGHCMIQKLVCACLLERVKDAFYGTTYVKMHDVVRAMCLWLTGGHLVENTFLIDAYYHSNRASRFQGWEHVRRISLIREAPECEEKWPPVVSPCPNLHTLLYIGADMCIIREGFFSSTLALRVLNLECTAIQSLPDEICSLMELRYLNLRKTPIRTLPAGLGNLTNIRQLNLTDTFSLSHIPREAITTLTRLQVLGTVYDSVLQEQMLPPPPPLAAPQATSRVSLQDMDTYLVQLEELRLHMKTMVCLELLLTLDRLPRFTRYLDLDVPASSGITTRHLSEVFQGLENLRELCVRIAPQQMPNQTPEPARVEASLDNRSSLEYLDKFVLSSIYQIEIVPPAEPGTIFPRLRSLDLSSCDGIRDLTWVRGLPCLDSIRICDCPGIEELLLPVDGLGGGRGEDEASNLDPSFLPALKKLSINNLPALSSISRRPLLLPSLECLSVTRCPRLTKLPLGSDSAKNLREILCHEEWWNRLKWCGQSLEARFVRYFRPRHEEA